MEKEKIYKMVEIKDEVLKPYTIKVDPNGGYVVSKLKKTKKGEEYEENICYPSTLQHCINKISLMKVNDEYYGETISLRDYVDRVFYQMQTMTEQLKF